VNGSGDELVPESRPALDGMLAELAERKAVEIVITGTPIRWARTAKNDQLSLARAAGCQKQRGSLAAHGVQSDPVTAVGRGERDCWSRRRIKQPSAPIAGSNSRVRRPTVRPPVDRSVADIDGLRSAGR